MFYPGPLMTMAALLIVAPTYAAETPPSVEQFEQVLEAQLQKLKTSGFTERTVLFQEVQAATPNGGYYPFQVTATLHDYGPGYPANRYYGQTCVGKMERWKFDMLQNDSGAWIVQGRMTPSDSVCKDNPSEGVSAIPLAGLPGKPVDTKSAAPPPKGGPGKLYLGEYACYGVGSRLMAGMGFRLDADGSYRDVDGGRGGTYSQDAAAATLSFRGGFLDGQVGRNVRNSGFQLSSTVSCEPWR